MPIPPFISDNKQLIAAVVAGVFAITAAYIRRDKRLERTHRKKPVARLLLFPLVYLLLGVGLLAGEIFSMNLDPEGELNLDNPGGLLCLAGSVFIVAGVVWLPLNLLRLLFWPKPPETPEPMATGEPGASGDSLPVAPAPRRKAPAVAPAAPRKATSGFLFTAFVWLLVIGLGTVGSHYYEKWAVEDRKNASAQMQGLERDFKVKWQEALDTCADTPSVDDYANRMPWLYRTRFAGHLQSVDDTLNKKHPRMKLACDSFSGYCVFRSRAFQAKLADQDVLVHLIDDKADYKKRIKTLQSGETPLAVFTIDALINNSALLDSPPAAIVMVIDESQGADAMVSYQDALPNLQALNHKDLKIVLTPDSPSETLARLVRFHYDLPDLPKECFIEADDAQDVYARFKKADPGEPTAFVLWEPYVSQLLREYPQAHKLIDSADPKCRGYIMDVLVVQKEFLDKNRPDVENIVKAYLEAAAGPLQAPDGMVKLVQVDSTQLAAAGKLTKDLTYPEAEQVVKGIRWKNTRQNYAHFGLAAGEDAKDVEPLEDAIKKITTVLVKTKAISRSVKESLVDKEVCASLQKENFDESKGNVVVVPSVPFDPGKDWGKLQPVPGVEREPISFRRGSFDLSMDSIDQLQEVAKSMKSLSDCYLEIQGSPLKTEAADVDLAQKRADAVFNWLRDAGGVAEKRMKVRIAAEKGDGHVNFVFLKPPH